MTPHNEIASDPRHWWARALLLLGRPSQAREQLEHPPAPAGD
jgi:hypothetical protein